jgi:hypothetical protein
MKREMGKGESPARLIAARFPTLVQFFAAQGFTLIGNLVYGVLCVRLLPHYRVCEIRSSLWCAF